MAFILVQSQYFVAIIFIYVGLLVIFQWHCGQEHYFIVFNLFVFSWVKSYIAFNEFGFKMFIVFQAGWQKQADYVIIVIPFLLGWVQSWFVIIIYFIYSCCASIFQFHHVIDFRLVIFILVQDQIVVYQVFVIFVLLYVHLWSQYLALVVVVLAYL